MQQTVRSQYDFFFAVTTTFDGETTTGRTSWSGRREPASGRYREAATTDRAIEQSYEPGEPRGKGVGVAYRQWLSA